MPSLFLVHFWILIYRVKSNSPLRQLFGLAATDIAGTSRKHYLQDVLASNRELLFGRSLLLTLRASSVLFIFKKRERTGFLMPGAPLDTHPFFLRRCENRAVFTAVVSNSPSVHSCVLSCRCLQTSMLTQTLRRMTYPNPRTFRSNSTPLNNKRQQKKIH